ncbi:MAG: TlpA family protein disulfide reductase [Rhodoblastus sp.]
MISNRRLAMAGLFAWTGLLAFSPLLDWKKQGSGFTTQKKRGKLTVVYVGAEDCAPCLRWRNERRPDFKKSVAFERIDYREIIATRLADALDDKFWPDAMRPLRTLIEHDGGGVPYWILMRDGRIVTAAGGEKAWDRKVWPRIIMEV